MRALWLLLCKAPSFRHKGAVVSILGHKKGLYRHEHADVFVTVGTGMVGVPFRFRVPPTIDIIELI